MTVDRRLSAQGKRMSILVLGFAASRNIITSISLPTILVEVGIHRTCRPQTCGPFDIFRPVKR